MPHLQCPRCRVSQYSAPSRSRIADACAVCGLAGGRDEAISGLGDLVHLQLVQAFADRWGRPRGPGTQLKLGT